MSIKNYEYNCTKKCKNSDHGQKITSVLTKRAVEDNILATYIAKVCQNFANIHDYLGKTGLHIGASVGKYVLCEWLLNNGASINSKDYESGSSPLHRALFYGCIDCAVLLIRNGASLKVLDNDTYTPLQNICKMKDLSTHVGNSNDILVWRSNKSYNLGFGNNAFPQLTKVPQFIDLFRKNNISILYAAVSPFHSLFLDNEGNLYSVGLGSKGRLGINSEDNLAVPQRVPKINFKNSEEKINQLSVSCNHSMILTSKGLVYVCGSNEHKQLGLKQNPDMLMAFKRIPYFQQCRIENIVGISAKDFYSIAYTKTKLYVWGTNLGQYPSADTNNEILLPKQIQIPDYNIIECVEACNSAIAVATSGNHILLYYNYKMKVIKPPVLEAIKSLSLIVTEPQKPKEKSKGKSPLLRLLLLSDTNVVYMWSEDVQQYLRCSFAQFRLPIIDKIFFKHNQVFLMSQGDVYLGKCNKMPISNIIKESETAWLSSKEIKKEINGDYKIRIELNRIDGIDRAVDIFCDENLESFAVLQEHSRKYYVLPKLYSEEYNFKKLFNDVNEFDIVHDLIFHVNDETFYAHKFIIYSRSKGLKAIVEQFNDKDIYLNYNNFTAKMFELILKYIYCNYFLTLDDIDDISHSLGPNLKDYNTFMEILIEVAEKFTLTDFISHIKSQFQITNTKSNTKPFDKTKSRFNRVRRSNFSSLYDVKIKCANNQELKAHKCVLVTRSEYFKIMFTDTWSQTSTIHLTNIPVEHMEPILDFLYSADIDNFKKQNYNENFLFNMIVICDQFFINRLRNLCEILLLENISIRKCGEMLEFAELYNCEILRRGCMDFICQNLSRILVQRGLEVCEPETLKNLNIHYRQIFQNIFDFRVITPDNESFSDDELLKFVGDSNVDLDYRMKGNITSSKQTKRNKNREKKFKTDASLYEKDVILKKLKELHKERKQNILNQKKELLDKRTNNLLKEAGEINEKLISSLNSWIKIKNKRTVAGNANTNNILKEEKRNTYFANLNKMLKSPNTDLSKNELDPCEPNSWTKIKKERTVADNVNINNILKEVKRKTHFVNLNKMLKSPNIDLSKNELELCEPLSCHIIKFGDFTPIRRAKMSQKQRRRLSSEASTKLDTSTKQIDSPNSPIEIPIQKPNAWRIMTRDNSPNCTFLDL